MRLLRALALVFGLGLALTPPAAGASDPNALWHVVHDLCVIDMKVSHLPAPCLKVDLRHGYAALKDLKGKTQILVIPTARVTGIESARLLEAGGPNYWQAAWDSRRLFEARAGGDVPRDEIGLAVNSMFGRSQNQLHIHIDCVRTDVIAALKAHEAEIGADWKPLDVGLAGERYRARRLVGDELEGRDPFRILAREGAETRADMGRQTLAVIGARFSDGESGFILLAATGDTSANPEGASETLLDHACAVLNKSARPAPA